MKKIYAIKDTKANSFMEITEGQGDGVMCRTLSSIVNDKDKKSLIAAFPQDFELWKIAEMNEETGEIKQDLRKIADASDWVDKNA